VSGKPRMGERGANVVVPGSAEWRAWVDELVAFDRKTITQVVDRALMYYAERIGFTTPPPPRARYGRHDSL
jgi:ferric-dicitrate binding protein FerR (iron transport regulator)